MNTVEIAERATLGALLLDPGQIRPVSAWLAESDFDHPRSAITYRLLTTLADRKPLPGPVDLLQAALADPVARRNDVAGPYVHELLASPGGPGRSSVYGGMVLQASALRTLAADAADLARRAAGQDHCETVQGLLEAIGSALRRAVELDGRLACADPAYVRQPGGVLATCGTDRPASPGRRELESEVVAGLQDNVDLLPRVCRWLAAANFEAAEHAGTYASMLRLGRLGLPVDHVTTLWNRRDGFASVDAPAAHDAATRQRRTRGQTLRLARHLLARSIAEQVAGTAGAIMATGHDPRPSTRQRLHTAVHLLRQRQACTARWLAAGEC